MPWPIGATPRSRRRSSIRSLGACSARWAWTRPSSISIPTPGRRGCAPAPTERYAPRGARWRGAPRAAPELPVVGAVGPGGAGRGAGGRPDAAPPERDRARRACRHRDAPSGVLPEQRRLSGRPDPGRRRHPPAGAAADPRRARDRGGCRPDDPERGQRRLRLQLDVLPGGGAAAADAGRLPRLHHAQQAPGRALHRHRLQQARQDGALPQSDGATCRTPPPASPSPRATRGW